MARKRQPKKSKVEVAPAPIIRRTMRDFFTTAEIDEISAEMGKHGGGLRINYRDGKTWLSGRVGNQRYFILYQD